MAHPPGGDAAEARLPRARRLTKKVLEVPPFRFGEGRECTFAGALAAATGAEYDWILGCSGAAFRTRIDAERWDPIAAAPLDPETVDRGARAAGMRPDRVAPPFDDDLRALVLDRVAEAIAAKLPPLVQGIGGQPEYGLIVGYDDAVPTFYVRTYFDKGKDPTKVGWDALAGEAKGEPVFLDRAPAPARDALARAAVRIALDEADATLTALEAWVGALRDDGRWSDARHAGSAAFADHAMRTLYEDERRAGARFLRGARELFPQRAGADLLRAAEAYGYAADAAAKAGVRAFDASVATRFIEKGQRRAWAALLDTALRHEREAHEALRAAAS